MPELRHARPTGRLVFGLFLILAGGWFFLRKLGVTLPGLEEVWPAFPMLAGLGFIAGWFLGSERNEGLLLPGVGSLLVGGFFLMITLGPLHWSDMDRLWPVFPLIGGLAFLAMWAGGGMKDFGLLIPAGGGVLVGACGLLVTVAGLDPRLFEKGWPLALVLAGLVMVVRGLSTGRRV